MTEFGETSVCHLKCSTMTSLSQLVDENVGKYIKL